jgi:histidyl-tRNA synthetase
MSLNTKPYKGARDFYPEDKRLQKYIFSVWREVVERYGYEEYDAPIIEPIEIFLAKTGEEIVNEQTYEFIDRGKRHVVIRPEMTPSVSRMVAAKRQELAYPLRWYSIPNLWRYERPQKGRLREHWQLNVDLFGAKSIEAELELIQIVDTIFKAFGAKESMYEIRLNHRELTDIIFKKYLKLDSPTFHKVTKLIDRMHKMELTLFIQELDKVLSDKQKEEGLSEKILKVTKINSVKDLSRVLKDQPALDELKELVVSLTNLGITNFKYDPTLMRGFDYYTGLVFEVFDTSPDNNRSMMGGGRYDGLVGLFGVAPVPTVGFGWGDVTLVNFLEGHHLLPKLTPEVRAYVALIGDVKTSYLSVIQELRGHGINIAVDLSRKKLGDQLKAAEKKGIDDVIIIGKNELLTEVYTLRNLKTSKEESLSRKDLIKVLKANDSN